MPTSDQSIASTVRDITESSKQAFAAGQRISEDLEQLETKLHRATDWQARIRENPLWLVGGALLGGVLLWRLFR